MVVCSVQNDIHIDESRKVVTIVQFRPMLQKGNLNQVDHCFGLANLFCKTFAS